MRSYLEKETAVDTEADHPGLRRRNFRKKNAVRTFLLIASIVAILAAPLLICASQPCIAIRHDKEAIIAGLEAESQFWKMVKESQPNTAKFKSIRESTDLKVQYVQNMLAEKYTDAISDATQIIRSEQTDSAYSNRGNAYFMLGNYESALNDYQNALHRWKPMEWLDPNQPAAEGSDFRMSTLATYYSRRGDIYFHIGSYPDAFKDYRLTIALERQMTPTLIGSCLIALGEVSNSLGLYEVAAKLERAATESFASKS